MADRVVTFDGATPAGGGSGVGLLLVEDADGNRVELVKGQPQTVSEQLAKAAADVTHHNVTVETEAAHEKAQAEESA